MTRRRARRARAGSSVRKPIHGSSLSSRRQIATLSRAGISIVDGLKALIDQVESRDMEKVLRDVREKVHAGRHARGSDGATPTFLQRPSTSNMVKAGEASGQLDNFLSRLADYIVRQNRLRTKIGSALTYPIVMVVVGVLVVTVLMTFVVPKLTSLFGKVGRVPAFDHADPDRHLRVLSEPLVASDRPGRAHRHVHQGDEADRTRSDALRPHRDGHAGARRPGPKGRDQSLRGLRPPLC